MTVANFVRLAVGSMPTMDLKTGELAQAPFYDGLIFHKVWPNQLIQSGSPTGSGEDGVGYVFPDEFVMGASHDAAGVLSMANIGPNSNSSQFFITLDEDTSLNWRHTVFGRVVEGMSVVSAMGSADLKADGESPVAPVKINSVEIVRQGAAANAWDEMVPPLPLLSYNPMSLEPVASGSSFELFFTRRPFTRNYLARTSDLAVWHMLGSRGETVADSVQESFIRTDVPTNGANFYRATEDQKVIPTDMEGYTLRLIPFLLPSYTVKLGADFAGTYSHFYGSIEYKGTMSYRWYDLENVCSLHLIFDYNLVTYRNTSGGIVYVPNQPQQLSLVYTTATSGTFMVHYYRPNTAWDAYPDQVMSGTFFLTPP